MARQVTRNHGIAWVAASIGVSRGSNVASRYIDFASVRGMSFDDLARHMASRDGKAVATTADANDFIHRAAEDNRRIERRNNLVLGFILLAGGLVIGALRVIVLLDPAYQQQILAASSLRRLVVELVPSILWLFATSAAVIIGLLRLWRGLRGLAPRARLE